MPLFIAMPCFRLPLLHFRHFMLFIFFASRRFAASLRFAATMMMMPPPCRHYRAAIAIADDVFAF